MSLPFVFFSPHYVCLSLTVSHVCRVYSELLLTISTLVNEKSNLVEWIDMCVSI